MHQIHAIQQALSLIEKRLTEPLSIEELAREAAMSYWHFQRAFSAMVGEPVGRYLRRRRIAHAARRLFDFEGTILELALDYQFESHEAFTRAFKSELGATPSDWRDGRGAIAFPRPPERLSADNLTQRYHHMNLTPEILTFPPRSFAGLQARFVSAVSADANNLQVIPQLWEAFYSELPRIPASETDAFYGLCENIEAHGLGRRHPDEALYLAAARVPVETVAAAGIEVWHSPGGLFAKFIHRGRVEKIGETMGYIYGKWFPSSGYQAGEGPDIERYTSAFDPQSDDSALEIYIPIQKA